MLAVEVVNMLLRHIDARSIDWLDVEEELAQSPGRASRGLGRLSPEEVQRMRRLLDAEQHTLGMPHPIGALAPGYGSPIHFHGGSRSVRQHRAHVARAH